MAYNMYPAFFAIITFIAAHICFITQFSDHC
jgi:hypothetical protein